MIDSHADSDSGDDVVATMLRYQVSKLPSVPNITKYYSACVPFVLLTVRRRNERDPLEHVCLSKDETPLPPQYDHINCSHVLVAVLITVWSCLGPWL